jgi:hypothetical protein
VDLEIWGVEYSLARLTMLALGVAVGLALWLWLYQTKTGMVIRAGVDDRQMTSALGINIQVFFAIAFAVGAALVAMGAWCRARRQHLAEAGRGLAAELARRRHHQRHGILLALSRGRCSSDWSAARSRTSPLRGRTARSTRRCSRSC